jgi:hypothetical protein
MATTKYVAAAALAVVALSTSADAFIADNATNNWVTIRVPNGSYMDGWQNRVNPNCILQEVTNALYCGTLARRPANAQFAEFSDEEQLITTGSIQTDPGAFDIKMSHQFGKDDGHDTKAEIKKALDLLKAAKDFGIFDEEEAPVQRTPVRKGGFKNKLRKMRK